MGQKNEEVLVLDVADSQTISAGDPISVNSSGQAQKNSASLSANTIGIALTDMTFTTVASEGIRKKIGILTSGLYDFTGLVENDDSGTYTTNIVAGSPVSIYWSGSTAYVVYSNTNPIGTAQEVLTGNTVTTVEKEGVGTIAATGLSLDNAPTSGSVAIQVPGKVFTVTEDAGSAAAGVCDVNTTTGALIFNASDVTDYSGQQVYAKYTYDANADTTGSVEVRVNFLPTSSVITTEIANNAVGATDLDSTGSFTMVGLTVNNTTASSVVVANNFSAGGNIVAAGNVSATNITGNITDVTFGDITIGTANFTGAGQAIEVTNNASIAGTFEVDGTSTLGVISAVQNTTTGVGVTLSRDLASGSTDASVVKVLQDNASDDQHALEVQQDGSGNAIEATGNVNVTGNITASGNLVGNITDTTFGDITIASADFTGAGNAIQVTNNASIGGTLLVEGNSTVADVNATSATFTGAGTSTVITNNLSAGGTVVGSNLNVTDWDNAQTVLNTNSLGWEQVQSTVNSNSVGWENAESVLNTNSLGWENAESVVNTNSQGWEQVQSTVNTNSLGWENNETVVNTNSGNWGTAYTHSQNNTQAHSDYLLNSGNDTTSGTLSVNALEIGGVSLVDTDGDIAHPQTSTSGYGLSATRDLASGSTDSAVARFVQDNASDDQAAVLLQQDGPITPSGGIPVLAITCNSSNAAGSAAGYIPITVNGVDYRLAFHDVA